MALFKWKKLLSLAVFIFHLCYGELQYSHTIYIDSRPTIGNDTESCITSNSPSVPCKSLNWAFLPEHRQSSTQYILLAGPHYLNESVATFENLNNIAFVGNESKSLNTKVYCLTRKTGLAFIDVSDISFSRLTFSNCSAKRDGTSRNFNYDKYYLPQFYVGLYFYHCHNVNMHKVEVTQCPNATGVVMYDTDGTNKIIQSSFTDNVLSEGSTSPGGGGFYVEFSYCVPGDSQCRDNQQHILSHESRNRDALFIFSDCTFRNNRANTSSPYTNSTFVIPYRADHEAFGRGGGLSIFIKGNATGNRFEISNCQFESNHAVWGGGLFIELQDNTRNNTIQVTDSAFVENTCYFTSDSGTGGGGMRIGHYVYGHLSDDDGPIPFSLPGNTISVDHCQFVNNSALNGGGLSISSSLQNYKLEYISKLYINDTTFIGNIAKLGAALHIDRFSVIISGHMLLVYITNGKFDNNTVDYAKYLGISGRPHEVGLGALYIHEIKVTFQGKSEFNRNNGTALAVIGSPVDFSNHTSTLFQDNTGKKGGAIALLGSANMQISNNTVFLFYNNTAAIHGGAIYNQYIARESLKSYTDCFIRHIDPFLPPEDWNAHFNFFNNKDQGGTRNNSIYTTSIWPCSFTAGTDKDEIFHWHGWNFLPGTLNSNDTIASDIGNIAYTGESSVHNSVKAYPGIPFRLPLSIGDDYNSKMGSESIFSASTNTSLSDIGEYNFNFTYVQGNYTVVRGKENQNVVLEMDNLGDRVWHVEVVVELVPCPPGFKANTTKEPENTFCDCANRYGGALICDAEAFRAKLRNGNWLGQLDGHEYYLSAVCPPGYCYETLNHSAHFLLPKDRIELDALICGTKNRNGTLCGRCIEGFGPAVNSLSYECVNCTDENIPSNVAKYVASVYIPLIVLFTLLIIFDIRLTTGPANAFILYCQVVASTFDLNAGGQIPLNLFVSDSESLLKSYRVPYGIFNLEFIENFLPPLCLGTELNNLTVFLLDYAVAFCPLLMILIVIVCVRIHICIAPKCRRTSGRRWERITSMSFSASYQPPGKEVVRKGISEAVLPAFAAFLLLSYTKFTLASAYILSYRWLISEDGYINGTARVYFAGHFAYDSKDYVPYFLPACLIFCTIGLITPLLLLDYPLRAIEWGLSRVDCLWRFYPVDKIHVLLDTFQGCYKIKMRFFAGVYFLFRLTISVLYLAIDSWLDQFIVQQIACIIMIVLLAICQPYNEENKLFNYVDTLIFLNLAAVNALSLYLYAYTQNYPNTAPSTSAFAAQYILVFLPLIYMVSYIVWRVTEPCHPKMKNSARETFLAVIRRVRPGKYNAMTGVLTDNQSGSTGAPNVYANRYDKDEDPSEIEAIFARAEKENTYRPSPVVFEQNEPREDSALRSVQSGPAYMNYGSTGSSGSAAHNVTTGQPSINSGDRAQTD